MTFPTFIEEVAFASDPLNTSQVYTDLSTRVESRSFRRGRQTENDQTDTGSSSTTFENSDRALDPANAASVYAPNVLPMRRIRCRVANAGVADASPLTVSGNEITDAVRSVAASLGVSGSGQMEDGRSSDSSFGIWRSAQNLFRRGQCDALTDWGLFGTGVSDALDGTVAPPFSSQSVKYTCDGTAANQGLQVTTATGLAAAASSSGAGSIYFKGVAGASYQVKLRWLNTDASFTDGAATTFTATGAWQLLGGEGSVTVFALQVAGGKTGDSLRLVVSINGTRAESFWAAHPMLEKLRAWPTPYIASSGGGTPTHAGGRVRGPVLSLNSTQGWVAIRLRMGYPSSLSSDAGQGAFRWGGGVGELYLGWRSVGSWEVRRDNFPAVQLSAGDTFNVGDYRTIIFAWTATQILLSVDGAPFVAAANTTFPTLTDTLIDIGTSAGSNPINSEVLWFAFGSGTLTDAAAAAIRGYGNTASDASAMLWPANSVPMFVWQADTTTYRVTSDAYLYTNFIDPEQGWQLNQLGPAQMEAIAPANDGFDLLDTYRFTASSTFPQATAGVRINAILDAIGWSATERSIDTTSQQSLLQAANAGDLTDVSALAAIQAAAGNDNGVFYVDGRGYAIFKGRHRQADTRFTTSQATFADKANWVAGYFLYENLPPLSSKILNDYRITRFGGTEQTWSNATSITRYGRRSKPVATLHTSDSEALNYAQYRVSLDKDPRRRYDELTIRPLDDTATWNLVLNLQIGDRVTVIQSPPGGGTPDRRDMIIEAVRANIGPGVTASFTYRLSPANDQIGWVLGDSQYGRLGSTTILTY